MADHELDPLIRAAAQRIVDRGYRWWQWPSRRQYRLLAEMLVRVMDENEALREGRAAAMARPPNQDEMEFARRSAKCPLA